MKWILVIAVLLASLCFLGYLLTHYGAGAAGGWIVGIMTCFLLVLILDHRQH
jgi:hypothetical protein